MNGKWDGGDSVTLITRPRRFGKTLTMSMVEQFFSVDYTDRGDLFEGLSIWKEESYRKIQGMYPVISLSFANVKEKTYAQAKQRICRLIGEIYSKNRFLLESGLLSEHGRDWLLLPEAFLMLLLRQIHGLTGPIPAPTVTNLEVRVMFQNMIRLWFGEATDDYNDFVKALLLGNVKAMNNYMNRVALKTFSYFDTGKEPSGAEPERFYHGFVLGLSRLDINLSASVICSVLLYDPDVVLAKQI